MYSSFQQAGGSSTPHSTHIGGPSSPRPTQAAGSRAPRPRRTGGSRTPHPTQAAGSSTPRPTQADGDADVVADDIDGADIRERSDDPSEIHVIDGRFWIWPEGSK